MKKLLSLILSLSMTLFILLPTVYAEEFALTKIGALEVKGKYFSHWWYEPTNLTLEGTGSRGANIDIYIDGNVKTIKASTEDGKWKYTHEGALEKKDHSITVASGDQKISFVLTIGAGSVPAEQQVQSKGVLPDAGTILPVLGIVAGAGILIFLGFREKKPSEVKS